VNRSRLLNAELSHAIASMGHGDLMIVCDAGFPIPSSAWRIDLAISPDVPDLATVLTPISENLIVERLSYAFDPWGNILLYSGVDVPAWFSKPGVKAPDYYAKKLEKG